jgi:transcriptional regulator with XRE-family HTH domain
MRSLGIARRALSARVRDLLYQRRMRQTDLAEALNVSQPYVSHLLAGKRGISIDRLDYLARALDVTLSDLFSEPDEEGNYPLSLTPLECDLILKWRSVTPGVRRAVSAVLDLQERPVDSEEPFAPAPLGETTGKPFGIEEEGPNERRTTDQHSAVETRRRLIRMLADLTKAIESLRLPDDEQAVERRHSRGNGK